jgi:predicted nucleic acid-binding protein
MLVLDASAAVELLLRTGRGDRVAAHLEPESVQLHAPDLLWLEVASALRRTIRAGLCTSPRAEVALSDLGRLAIRAHRDIDLVGRAFAMRDMVTIYDGVYVALTQVLGARLLTCDSGMAVAAERTCDIVLVT